MIGYLLLSACSGRDASSRSGDNAGAAGSGAVGGSACSGAAGGSAGSGASGGRAGAGGTSSGGASGSGANSGSAGTGVVSPDDVVIAAAGDISNTKIGGQKITADLILAGTYDAVLTLGDNQYNDGALPAYVEYFDKTWGLFKDKLRPTPGNHEYNTPGATGYYDYFGDAAGDPTKGYYSYDLGAWHMVVLNSNSECGAIACEAGSEQELWLRADLAAHTQKCTLAYWHHPRFTSGLHGNSLAVSDFWKALHEGGVDVVLNGHDHTYERFGPQDPDGKADESKGIVEFVVGTGGTGFYPFGDPLPNSVTRQDTAFGVLRMILKPTGYEFEFVGQAGSTFTDQGSGQCH